jgi:hypothetical protein
MIQTRNTAEIGGVPYYSLAFAILRLSYLVLMVQEWSDLVSPIETNKKRQWD